MLIDMGRAVICDCNMGGSVSQQRENYSEKIYRARNWPKPPPSPRKENMEKQKDSSPSSPSSEKITPTVESPTIEERIEKLGDVNYPRLKA